MKKLIILKAIILSFFVLFANQSLLADQILPLPKPSVDTETKSKVVKKKEIYPQKKPKTKKEEIKTDVSEETTELIESTENVLIYPKKKPTTIVQKKDDKVVAKSSILSKKDFKIAKSAFQAIDKKKWQTALKLSKKARDKSLYNLVNYLYLKKPSNAATFYDYVSFINNNPYYPRISRLTSLAEHKINLKTNTPMAIMKWFGGKDPLSDFGKIKLGEIYLLQGDFERGSKLIKEGWIKAKLNKSNLRYLRKKKFTHKKNQRQKKKK